jgi:hypothetical protein
VHSLSASEIRRDGLVIEKGEDWYKKPFTLPDGTIIQLVPDEGWDFNPGKVGLKKSREIISNFRKHERR